MTRIPITIALATLLIASPAFAEEDPAEQAQKHFDAGAKAYMSGDYAGAIVEFLKGHKLSPSPLFLYNIADAHVHLGNYDKALASARDAEAQGLEDEVYGMNRGRIEAVRAILHAQATTAEISGASAVAVADEPEVSETVSTTDEGGIGTLGWAGIGTGAAGVVGLGVWGFLELGLQSEIQKLEDASAANDVAAYDEAKANIESDQGTAQIALIAGSVLTAAGVTLFLIDSMGGGESEVAVAPSVGTNGAGATVHWRF
jgi:tetratricopeptide (TPR) repeat protein